MTLWIGATLAATGFQTVRFMLQKRLSSTQLSAGGATFARFLYSAPLILVLLWFYLQGTGQALPELSGRFWLYGAIGGAAQVVATVLVVLLFKQRNFAVGITFKKTEVIQTVLIGLLVLGEAVSWAGFAFILLGVFALFLLSDPPDGQGRWRDRIANRAAAIGLASGFCFGISSVFYRGASLQVEVEDPLLRAAVTLAAVVSMQLLGMGAWLRWREVGEITRVWAARRVAGLVGLFSMGGSFCWFLAFTLQTAAYVKALGQVELIFSLLVSVLVFRETITGREVAGMVVLAVSIIGLVLVI